MGKKNKMKFKESKSKTMQITRKRSNDNIIIYLKNRRLELVKGMKYLGTYFDSRLTFDKHIGIMLKNPRS